MTPSVDSDFRAEDVEYMLKHNISKVMEEFVTQLLDNRPDHPVRHLREFLEKKMALRDVACSNGQQERCVPSEGNPSADGKC